MKYLTLILFIIAFTPYSHAQCFEYQSEMQNIESLLSSTGRSINRISKSKTDEEAQSLLEKAGNEISRSKTVVNIARDYAQDCRCELGTTYAVGLLAILNDLTLAIESCQKKNSLELMKPDLKNISKLIDASRELTQEALTYCLD
jgi:hypothetical protein